MSRGGDESLSYADGGRRVVPEPILAPATVQPLWKAGKLSFRYARGGGEAPAGILAGAIAL